VFISVMVVHVFSSLLECLVPLTAIDTDQLEVRANKGSKDKGSASLGTHNDPSLFHK
jgi:hypothetical protein